MFEHNSLHLNGPLLSSKIRNFGLRNDIGTTVGADDSYFVVDFDGEQVAQVKDFQR